MQVSRPVRLYTRFLTDPGIFDTRFSVPEWRDMAELATKGKDEQIRDLLEGQGITATLGDAKATKGATQ